jgi:hypothetical protein
MKRWMGMGKGLGGCLSKGLAKRAGDLLGFGLVGLGPAGQGFVGSGRSYDVQRSVGHEGGPQFGFKDGDTYTVGCWINERVVVRY